MRLVGPALAFALALVGAAKVFMPHIAHGIAPYALALGFLLWPPWRDASHARYRGTRWSVPVALAITAALGGGQFLVAYALIWADAQAVRTPSIEAVMCAALASCAAAGIALFIAWLRDDASWSLGLVRRDLGRAAWLGVRLGLLFVALDVVNYKSYTTADLWQLPNASLVSVVYETDDPGRVAVALLFGAVLVPFAEEVVFRGVLFAALRRSCGVVIAVLLSSTIFGALHFPEFWFPALLGVLFAVVYHRTGNLWACVVAHSIVNLAGLGLGFDHGRLLAGLTWTHVGAIVAAIGLAQMAARAWPSAGRCACSGGKGEGAGEPSRPERCPDCGTPLTNWPAAATLALRGTIMLAGVAIGGGLIAFDRMAAEPYVAGRSPKVLELQYQLLCGTERQAVASRLAAAWLADQPDALEPRLQLAQEAFLRGEFARVVPLVEPLLARGDMDARIATIARNFLALTYAEMGGPRAEQGVRLARQALEHSGEETRVQVEETLGWALVRVGQLEEARLYLDRELSTYGLTTRSGVAELAFHRGVLLWATGEEERARRVLGLAASLVPPADPYTRRAREIIDRGALPDGLVPALPPALPDVPEPAPRSRMSR